MAHVFLSHRGADEVLAGRLAEALHGCGHEVWLDNWEIRVGDSIIGKMNEGMADSTFLILCLSSDMSDAPWMDREWMSALADQLSGANMRVLPARLTGGTLPAILRDIKYADLVKDWQTGINALCKALG
jgi:hypothetical protein